MNSWPRLDFPQGDGIGMKYEVLLYRSLTPVFSVRVPALLVLCWVCPPVGWPSTVTGRHRRSLQGWFPKGLRLPQPWEWYLLVSPPSKMSSLVIYTSRESPSLLGTLAVFCAFSPFNSLHFYCFMLFTSLTYENDSWETSRGLLVSQGKGTSFMPWGEGSPSHFFPGLMSCIAAIWGCQPCSKSSD